MSKRTKIICTIGPSSESKEQLSALIDAGMNIARINFSHGSYEEHLKRINTIKQLREEKKVPLGIMLDTKGPEIRIDKIQSGKMEVKKGDLLLLYFSPQKSLEKNAFTVTPSVAGEIQEGMHVLIDDGLVSTLVKEKNDKGLVLEVENEGLIQEKKGVNVPGCSFSIPPITEKDKEDLLFGIKHEVNFIAASFVCDSQHVLDMRKFLENNGGGKIKIIAKIESVLGLENFEQILHVSDGIMVARGDLGVEIPIKQVPRLQKEMIRKSLHKSKPVVIATQMLQSMIENPRPTRAEVSDVANAIYDGCSAVMLSGESAIGKYPLETVSLMKNIIEETEKDINYYDRFLELTKKEYFDTSSAIALACVKTCYSSHAKAIVACTASGKTSRAISRFRPEMPILALTDDPMIYHQLSIQWGVIPVLSKCKDFHSSVNLAGCFALANHILEFGDLIIVSSGTPFGKEGSTNMMMIQSIGSVLVRGIPSSGDSVHGKVVFFISQEDEIEQNVKEKIVVVAKLNEEISEKLKAAKAIVVDNHPDDEESERIAKNFENKYNIPVLLRADNAIENLSEGMTVTLDPQKGLIIEGVFKSYQEMVNHQCPID